MDASTKKACFDEISHQICDADAKVNINDISSNWKVNLRDSERLLWDWYELHKQQAMCKEFLIRGIDLQGHCVISVIKESQLPAVEKMFPKCSSSLFSLELPAPQCNRLGTHQLSTDVVVNLPIEPKSRDCTSTSNAKGTANTPKPLASSASGSSSVNGVHKAVPPKVEQAPPKAVCKTEEPVKNEPETPKKASPKKISPKKSASKTAASSKPATGKSSIASFFSKPAANKTASIVVKQSPPDVPASPPDVPDSPPDVVDADELMDTSEVVSESRKSPPKTTSSKKAEKRPAAKLSPTIAAVAEKRPKSSADVAASRKRSLADLVDSDHGDEDDEGAIPPTPTQVSKRKKTSTVSASKKRHPAGKATATSDDDIPGTPQTDAGKQKSEKKATTSRVRQIVDSSDDEVGAQPDKASASSKRPPAAVAGKRKAKRTVTRTFEDEDGYIKTVKEIEEYTCSEGENEPNKDEQSVHKDAKTAPPPNKAALAKISPPNKAPVAAKQGSIMSFFKKK